MKDLRALFSLAARYQWFRAVAVLSFWASSSNGPAAAQTVQPVPAMQAQPGYYRLKMGDVNITALSDGTVPLDTHPLLLSITAAQTDKLLAAGYQRNPVEASVNAYIIELGSRLVMVDAGTGELLGPTLDRLTTSMRAAGYQSEQFTDILVTHIHSDHTGGLTAGTRRVFPNATLHISQVEADFWLSEANAQNPAYARLQHWFAEAHAKVDPPPSRQARCNSLWGTGRCYRASARWPPTGTRRATHFTCWRARGRSSSSGATWCTWRPCSSRTPR